MSCSQPAPRLENAASRVSERLPGVLRGPRLGHDGRDAGRRRVQSTIAVGCECGTRHGRDAEIANHAGDRRHRHHVLTSTVIATRGERLVLSHVPIFGRAISEPEAFHTELLAIVEIDADERIVGDRRRSTPTTSTPPSRNSTPDTSPARRPPTRARGRSIARAYAAFNRRELPATTPDWVNVDHRRGTAFAPGDLTAYIHAVLGRHGSVSATSRRCIG